MNEGKQILNVMDKVSWYNQWLFNFFKPYLKGEILEVGAGIGSLSKLAKNYGQLTVIDIDKKYVKKLKNIKGISAGIGDIEQNKYFFENKKYDSIFSSNVFEHIEDDEKAFLNTYKLLKKEGILIILVPAHQFLFGSLDESLDHYRRYSKKELKNKLEKVGYKILEDRYLNIISPFGWFVIGRILKRKIFTETQTDVFSLIARPFLFFEKFISPPFGLSIFIIAKK